MAPQWAWWPRSSLSCCELLPHPRARQATRHPSPHSSHQPSRPREGSTGDATQSWGTLPAPETARRDHTTHAALLSWTGERQAGGKNETRGVTWLATD